MKGCLWKNACVKSADLEVDHFMTIEKKNPMQIDLDMGLSRL